MSKNIFLTDQELLLALEKRDELAIEYLYRTYWPVIQQMVKVNSGSKEEAEDLYQESILDFLEKLWKNKLVLNCKLGSYIYSICRKKWLYQLRGRPKFIDVEEYIELETDFDDPLNEKTDLPDEKVISAAINELGEPCKSLLIGYYYENLSMQQLAVKLNYKSESVAKQQKFRCKDRLKNVLLKII